MPQDEPHKGSLLVCQHSIRGLGERNARPNRNRESCHVTASRSVTGSIEVAVYTILYTPLTARIKYFEPQFRSGAAVFLPATYFKTEIGSNLKVILVVLI